MKKILVLVLMLTICLSLFGSSGAAAFAEENTYGIGETWRVDGEWEFTITEVNTHSLCSEYENNKNGYTNQQVIAISYTFRNIGYNGWLDMSPMFVKVYDEAGEEAVYYTCICPGKRTATSCMYGTKSSGTVTFVLKNPSKNVKIEYDAYKSKEFGKETAVFNLGIGQKASMPTYAAAVEPIENILPTYTVGQTWKAGNDFEFTVTGVEAHSLCNSADNRNYGYTNQQVVCINYTYKNIGVANGLCINLRGDLAYDGIGESANAYNCNCTPSKRDTTCQVGAQHSASVCYVLMNPSQEMLLSVKNPLGSSNESVVFKLNIANQAVDVNSETIKVMLNGERVIFDVEPCIINDRTMVPVRAIFEALSATVQWDEATRTVTSRRLKEVKLTIDSPIMYVDGVPITLDSPACIIDGRTLVPVRAVSEAFGCTVAWDEQTRTVILTE